MNRINPAIFGVVHRRSRVSFFIDSLKKSACWLKMRGGGLNFEGAGESNKQLQRKR